MGRLNAEELDRQMRRVYPDDRLPGLGLDRNALGKTGMARLPMPEFFTTEELVRLPSRDGRCRQCGEPILGRPGSASTCLIHRGYPSPPDRQELVALVEEYETVVMTLRAAVVAMDEEAGA